MRSMMTSFRSDRYAVGYLRRSSVSAEAPGEASREAQEQAVQSLAGLFSPGEELIVEADWGISGGRNDRPGYLRMKAAIESGQVSAAYAYSLSRFGRSARELDAFFELCKAHGVKVMTKAEGVLSSDTAMGQFLLVIMAGIAQLERELAKERTGVARQARKARHEAAGLAMPPSLAPYGYLHVTENGLTRVVRDESIRFEPIIEAYEAAGSIRQTAVRLNELHVPAPKGGLWGLNTTRRVLTRLAEDGLIVLPEPNKRQRHPVGKPSLLAGLVVCHCGHRMTPNTQRGQLYCASARTNADHGRMSVTEAALLEVLRPEADLFVRTIRLEERAAGAELAKQRGVIERRQAALDAKLDVDRISPEAYKEATRALHQELADLHRDAAVARTLRIDKLPSWDDVRAMNAWLRKVWTKVQLDPDMRPTAVWRDPRSRFDAELVERQEAELLDPEAAGLVTFPAERRASAS